MTELALRRPFELGSVRAADGALAVLWGAAVSVALWRGGSTAGQLVLAVEVSALCAIAWWDSRTLRAPNRAVLPAFTGTLAAAALFGADAMLSTAAGAVIALGAMVVLAALGRGRLGGGDVKFGALCGAVAGLAGALTMLAAAFIAGGLVAAVVLLFRLRKPSDVMAFTPLLTLGTVVAIAIHGAYHQL